MGSPLGIPPLPLDSEFRSHSESRLDFNYHAHSGDDFGEQLR